MTMDFAKRRRTALRELRRRKLDCLLVTNPANWYYLTGFTGDSGALLVRAKGRDTADGRAFYSAGQGGNARGPNREAAGVAVQGAGGIFLARKKVGVTGYDPAAVTVAAWKALRKAAGSKWRGVEADGSGRTPAHAKDARRTGCNAKGGELAGQVFESVLKLIGQGCGRAKSPRRLSIR